MLWVCIGGAGAADRGLGDVGLAAELPQPRPRHRAGAGRASRPRWSCSPARSAASSGAAWSTVPACSARRQAAARWRCCAWLRCSCSLRASARRGSACALTPQAQFALIAARRLPDDLHGRPGVGDRHRRDPPRRARHRRVGAVAVPEPVRSGGSAPSSPACCPMPVGLATALTAMPAFAALVAAAAFLLAAAQLRSRQGLGAPGAGRRSSSPPSRRAA